MSSAVGQRKEDVLDFTAAVSGDHARAVAAARVKIRLLKQLTMELQQGLGSLDEAPIPVVEQGLDFYKEVRRFEITLITRALRFMAGHQGKTARLLNMNATTLNAKMKQYEIQRVVGEVDFFEMKEEI
jgi:DNA-binding NtrC family response regulator